MSKLLTILTLSNAQKSLTTATLSVEPLNVTNIRALVRENINGDGALLEIATPTEARDILSLKAQNA